MCFNQTKPRFEKLSNSEILIYIKMRGSSSLERGNVPKEKVRVQKIQSNRTKLDLNGCFKYESTVELNKSGFSRVTP